MTPEPMSEDEEDPLHDSCLVEIWPRKFSERYEELRIIERVARLYGIFLGVRGAQRMGATAFRTFSRYMYGTSFLVIKSQLFCVH